MLDWFWMGFIIQKCVIFGTSHPKETHTYSSDCKRSWRKGATMRKESICWKNSDILAQSGGQKVSLNGWWKESSQVATLQNFVLGRFDNLTNIWETIPRMLTPACRKFSRILELYSIRCGIWALWWFFRLLIFSASLSILHEILWIGIFWDL